MDSETVYRALSSLWILFYEASFRPLMPQQLSEMRRLVEVVEGSTGDLPEFRAEITDLSLSITSSGIFDSPGKPRGVPEIRARIDTIRAKMQRGVRV